MVYLFNKIYVYFYTCRRPTGIEGEFFIQLFVEPGNVALPDTQSLLHKMFMEHKISFAEVSMNNTPYCLKLWLALYECLILFSPPVLITM